MYRAALDGGAAERITTAPPIDGLMHFLHGVSPDGSRLAFVGVETEDGNWAKANIFTVASDGSDYKQLTFGSAPAPPGTVGHPPDVWVDLMP
jgi:TolB protein